MTDNETPRPKTVAEQQETSFIVRVIGVVDQAGALVQEYGSLPQMKLRA
jgi:hypothetical protein